eukprot:640118-Amphidinium_carterae.1
MLRFQKSFRGLLRATVLSFNSCWYFLCASFGSSMTLSSVIISVMLFTLKETLTLRRIPGISVGQAQELQPLLGNDTSCR